jgi:mono/diheme cytochrome c family protein
MALLAINGLYVGNTFADDSLQNQRQRKIPSATFSMPATTSTTTTTYQPATSTGRLLASNCFQCHGTNGTGGFERITGGEASEIYDYAGKAMNSDIMAVHGQGYTTAQLSSLIGYLNQIR